MGVRGEPAVGGNPREPPFTGGAVNRGVPCGGVRGEPGSVAGVQGCLDRVGSVPIGWASRSVGARSGCGMVAGGGFQAVSGRELEQREEPRGSWAALPLHESGHSVAPSLGEKPPKLARLDSECLQRAEGKPDSGLEKRPLPRATDSSSRAPECSAAWPVLPGGGGGVGVGGEAGGAGGGGELSQNQAQACFPLSFVLGRPATGRDLCPGDRDCTSVLTGAGCV